jgi:spore germination cell wall hydrolase CwlJ-like protein
MKRATEPRALKELHRIRERMAEEARKVGVLRYYLALNKSSEWLRGKPRTRQAAAAVCEKPTRKYGS